MGLTAEKRKYTIGGIYAVILYSEASSCANSIVLRFILARQGIYITQCL
jgi:hypothetical protein